MMRAIGCLLVLFPLLATVGCGSIVTARRDFALTAPWQNYARIVVHSRNGNIEIASGGVKQIEISGSKHAGGLTIEEAEANVDQIEIIAAADAGDPRKFVVEVSIPEELRYKSPGASLVVHVPEALTAELHTSNGSIRAERLTGPSRFDTSNGQVWANEIDGPVEAETSNGRIEMSAVKGALRAETSNGLVVLKSITGNCTVSSSNGSLRLSELRGNVNAETSNGDIHLDAAPADAPELTLRTSNGSIQLVVPPSVNAELELSTSNGRIRLDMASVPLKIRETSSRRLDATMNNGGGKITATSSNGSITLRGR